MNKKLILKAGAVMASLALMVGTAGVASAKETVKLAFIGPLSGSNSSHGLGGRNSAELAVKLHNADPKAKYEFELVSLDDECKPNVGVQVATRAAADKSIKVIIPHYCSAVAVATVDVYERFKAPVIVWAAVHPDVTYKRKTRSMHRVSATLISQNKVAAKFFTDMGYRRWAAIYDTTDYGKSMFHYFNKFLTEDTPGEMLASFGVSVDQQDLNAELTKIKEVNPEIIYFGSLTPLSVRGVTQMDRLGIDAQFQGTSGMVGDAFLKGAGDLAEGVMAMYDMPPVERLPGGKFFLEEYAKQNYNEPFEAYGPYAFTATQLAIDVIERVGPDREKILDALADVKDYDAIIGKVTFDDHGQNINPSTTKYIVQDGKWIDWEDSEYATGKRKLKGR
ncbi:branched-chain amino acid ABC transporter substrate-binding protein [Castellaniella sp. S9]|uniref:branched-chain amino acid ABC transporter substrate-binding protein n=1 Tax=Castellaniella sp. S9 TaxID=2993652 RepID=UPI0022B565D0|nr:branched-chain amino acid ABC transporter substrate-binding protein [Castellaniella sp. S9]